jgi:D-alanyl-D-alanine carboxypeptidase
VATYHNAYDQIGGALQVSEGETMLMRDLLYGMVVGSANNAAYALVGNMGYSVDEFVDLMNQAASDLELEHTRFGDPSGLAVENITTAEDYARLLSAVAQTEDIAAISATIWYEFTTINTGNYHDFFNTNSLLRTSDLAITASKTGYIDEALYCLAMQLERDEHSIITVVLGAPSSSARFSESERLAEWAFANYQW